MISVIIPTYNRKHNLRRVFACLDKQDNKDFDVIVSDDGSVDSTIETVVEFSDRLNIQYFWNKNNGFRAPVVRNNGARLSKNDYYLFLDSDIMLNPAAISHYYNFINSNPDAIIIGRYDWLEPMDFSVNDVYANWDKIISGEMPKMIEGKLKGVVGVDPRAIGVSVFDDKVHENYCLAMFSGNILIPKNLYWSVGGFDEDMIGHGGEDCELAMRLQKAGYKAIFTEKTIGYHIYHDRNQIKNTKEVKKNIEYIKDKHWEFMKSLKIVEGDRGELPLVQK